MRSYEELEDIISQSDRVGSRLGCIFAIISYLTTAVDCISGVTGRRGLFGPRGG